MNVNDYGSQIVQELRKVVEINKGMVLKTEFYMPGKKMGSNIRRVAKSLIEIPVNDEGEPLFQEVEEGEEIPIGEDGKPLFQDIKNFKSALLIADGSRKLVKIANSLEQNGYSNDNSKLLGLSQWDGNIALQKEIFTGAWYTDIPKNNFEIYKTHFYNTYSYSPSKISSLAYDIVSVISALAASSNEKAFDIRKIITPIGYSGIAGVFRFKDSGIVERLLEIYEVDQGNIETIDPAAFQFSN